MATPLLGIGWDVGGWHGRKQAVAVARCEDSRLEWCGAPANFSIAELRCAGGGPLNLVRIAWPDAPDDLLEHHRVTIAMDAPLGFPEAFRHLLNNAEIPSIATGSFQENRLAFRDTDRWVFDTFGKRPMSAAFDRLGNAAATAIVHARAWSQSDGFRILPQERETNRSGRTIIEVYPALLKGEATGGRVASQRIANLLPSDIEPATDQYDAAICAVLACGFSAMPVSGATPTGLPPLIEPPASIPQATRAREGWIYCVPRDWFIDETT